MVKVSEQATDSSFQFPTNGKVHLNVAAYRRLKLSMLLEVSIPYERESTSELGIVCQLKSLKVKVSIPYERESTSEHIGGGSSRRRHILRFNSLRTGKYI